VEDPHGHPIPTANGEITLRNLKRLCDCRVGEVIIREASDDNPARLRRWSTLGLIPGARVRIISYEELDDIFELEVDQRIVRLGSEGLAGLRGELFAPVLEAETA
jgi:DtxR family transcriptional regulator, Mn-dependent transcriptional regulator